MPGRGLAIGNLCSKCDLTFMAWSILPWQPKVCMPVAEHGMGRGEGWPCMVKWARV